MRSTYTYSYIRKSVATISVTASNDEEAQQLAVERLEITHPECTEEEVETEFLDLKDVEPDGPDREEE